jgi:membrane-bound ClpP family serine protease
MWSYDNIRRVILFTIGCVGLLVEIFTPPDGRITLIILNLMLVGLVPIDVLITRRLVKSGNGKVAGNGGKHEKPTT